MQDASRPSAPRRTLLKASSMLLALASAATAVRAQGSPAKGQRLVLQVSDADPGKWNLALNNAANVQAEFGGPSAVDVEVVVYGPGIGMLKSGSPVAQRIAAALQAGVQVVACENTMHAQKLTPADMLPAIGYVPSGVGELVKKQHAGWAYVRP